ncbi:MAG TPA: hypothetical protein VGO92_02050 [Acidimicrobiales bacterium]|jgi:hypothetical protein|nr:hypothetical protein [Acidimicrobiales bacterium]
MTTFVLRVWLPDRPGALGAVASRIGAVRGDLVGIDILERGAGRVIDELVVELPEDDLLALLVQEISQVDGVDVEDAHAHPAPVADPRVDALETAATLVEQADRPALFKGLTSHLAYALEAEWVLVSMGGEAVAAVGETPPMAWIAAFVAGTQSSAAVAAGECGPDDVACAWLDDHEVAVVLGRRGRPFRARERRQLAALARIAGRRLVELPA